MFKSLAVKAIKKADHVRAKLGLTMFEPVNVFDACDKLGLSVRFIDINMEGMYITSGSALPTILISNQRPLPRRIFTCAHELGHHFFGHGTKVDALINEDPERQSNDGDEYLADVFAASLLMPVAGIQAELIRRNWDLNRMSPTQLFTICSTFGCGYTTLIGHCKSNGILSDTSAKTNLKHSPARILQELLGATIPKSYFKIVDEHYSNTIIDLEVGNYILFPKNIVVNGSHLRPLKESALGMAYLAEYPGVVRVANIDGSAAYFVRIQNSGYIGLAENRHLENLPD